MDNLVFSNILHRPMRTLVSVLGIALGVLLIVFTVGMANGSLRKQAEIESNVGAQFFFCSSGSNCFVGSSAFLLPTSLKSEIEKVEGVDMALPLGQTSVKADTAQGTRLVDGIDFEEYAKMTGIHMISGKIFEPGRDEVIIDTGFQRQSKLKIGDIIYIWGREFYLTGTYEPACGGRVKMPLDVMQKQVIGKESSTEDLKRVSGFLVRIKRGADEETVANNLQAAFPKNQLVPTKDLEAFYLNSYPALNVFLDVIIGVAATISGLVILLTMYTTVTERTRQIGILKSLGMSNGKIATTIAKEALLISFIGIVSGVLFTILLRFVLQQFINLDVEISPKVIGITLVAGLLGGAIGALYPALRAARQDAVEALSYE